MTQNPQAAAMLATASPLATLRLFVCAAIAAAAVIAPMALRGDASGHDFAFHLSSWMDVAAQWRHGIIYPRWAEWANWGFGEPRFIFYPPLSWMLGAAIGSVLPWKMAASAFIWIALTGSGISMHKLAHDSIAEPQAIIAAVLYVVNPYNLVIVYYRSAFGELLAVALMPLLVWAALRVMRGGWRRAPALALVFAAIWLSDVPAAVIATYGLVVMFAAGCTLQRSWRPIARGAAAMAGGFGLAAFYILPAAREQRWVRIAQVTADNLQPARNFLFTRANDADFVAFNWKVSAAVAGIAVVTVIAVAAIRFGSEFKERSAGLKPTESSGAIAGLKPGASTRRGFAPSRKAGQSEQEQREIWWMLTALAAASLAMMLPISAPLWRFLPDLQFIQFPWRWAGMLAVAFAFLTSAALHPARKRNAWIAGVALAAAIGCGVALMIRDAWWDADGAADIVQAIQSGRGYEGTDEYQPIGSDRSQLPGDPDDTERAAGVSADPAPWVSLTNRAAQPQPQERNGSDTRQNSAPFADFAQDAAPGNSKARSAISTKKPATATSESVNREKAGAQAELRIERWTAEQKGFTVNAMAPSVVALRLLSYPAWQVRVDGRPGHFESRVETGQMLVRLPAGEHHVEVRFVRTWDRELGGVISILALVAMGAFSLRTPREFRSERDRSFDFRG